MSPPKEDNGASAASLLYLQEMRITKYQRMSQNVLQLSDSIRNLQEYFDDEELLQAMRPEIHTLESFNDYLKQQQSLRFVASQEDGNTESVHR
jgi:hypothetical protein